MNAPSLQDVMNGMADRGFTGDRRDICRAPGSLFTERDAFIAVDPLLASLHKQHLEARARYGHLLAVNGKNDPMAEVAAIMADSAESAFLTRLIEVRRTGDTHAAALRLLREVGEREQKREQMKMREDRRRMEEFHDGLRNEQKARREARHSYDLALFLWWMLHHALESANRKLSLARSFSLASCLERVAGPVS